MDMTSQHQIFQNGHVLEKFYVLKAPRNTHPGDLIGSEVRYLFIFENHLPLLGSVKPVDYVVQTALARAVRADNGKYFPPFNIETHIHKGRYPTKAQGDLFALQDNFLLNATLSHSCLLRHTKKTEKTSCKPEIIRFPMFCTTRHTKRLFWFGGTIFRRRLSVKNIYHIFYG
jgi:hypothetical protein